MRSVTLSCVLALLLLPSAMQAQSPELSKTVQEFVRVRAPKIVLTHVRIIDGTGGPAVEDQNVINLSSVSQIYVFALPSGDQIFNLIDL